MASDKFEDIGSFLEKNTGNIDLNDIPEGEQYDV